MGLFHQPAGRSEPQSALPDPPLPGEPSQGKEIFVKRPIFPFSAILGQDQMKKALM